MESRGRRSGPQEKGKKYLYDHTGSDLTLLPAIFWGDEPQHKKNRPGYYRRVGGVACQETSQEGTSHYRCFTAKTHPEGSTGGSAKNR